MSDESLLRDKLRKIEALFAGAGTPGEAVAAKAAAERIRARLNETAKTEAAIEFRFSVPDPWSRQLFVALCRRYGLNPYRYPRMQRQTVIVRNFMMFEEGDDPNGVHAQHSVQEVSQSLYRAFKSEGGAGA